MSKKHRPYHGPGAHSVHVDADAEVHGVQADDLVEHVDDVAAVDKTVTLEDAAQRLLDELDPDHQRVLRD